MKKNTLQTKAVQLLCIAVIALIAYSNTFDVPFQFDDESSIVENERIKNPGNFFWFSKGKGAERERVPGRRYVGDLTFSLNYYMHGLDVAGYHIVNLMIHIINAILVFFIVFLTLKTPLMQESEGSGLRHADFLPLMTALVFAVHPIQTQAVTYIVQRYASLATMFYLFSILTYIKARAGMTGAGAAGEGRNRTVEEAGGRMSGNRPGYYILSVVSAVAAMKTKETAFTLPISICLYEFIFFDGKLKNRILYLIPIVLTMFIIPLSLTGTTRHAGDLIGDLSETTRVQTDMPRLDYLLTEIRVVVTYIRLVFLPINQNIDYDYQVYRSLFVPEVFLSLIFLMLILGSGMYLFYRFRTAASYTRLIYFGILWFFVTLSVESGVIPIADVIYEHRMYLPSMGIFLSAGTSALVLAEKAQKRWNGISRAACMVLVLVIAALTAATFARNRVWKDGITLWTDAAEKSPGKARVYFGLGSAYQNQGLFNEAVENYMTAIKLDPLFFRAHNNLGDVYQSLGFYGKAVEHFNTAAEIRPDAGIYYNLGYTYESMGLRDRAIEYFQTALAIDPAFVKAHVNLGNIYQYSGLVDRAIEHFRAAVDLKSDPDVFFNLGNACLSRGSIDEAIEHYQRAIRMEPDFSGAYSNLGVALQSKGDTDRAISYLQTAVKLDPGLIGAHVNLGRIYLKQNDREMARMEYEIVLQLDPRHREALKVLSQSFQEKKHNFIN